VADAVAVEEAATAEAEEEAEAADAADALMAAAVALAVAEIADPAAMVVCKCTTSGSMSTGFL
jgi:hypothetical protein